MQIWSCRTVFCTHNVRMCFVYCLRCSTVMDSYMLWSTQGRCIRNWQDIGFGLSPILSNKTTVKMLATETPVIVRTKRDFSSQRFYPVQRFLYTFNEHFVSACTTKLLPHAILSLVHKTLFLVSYGKKFFVCGPDCSLVFRHRNAVSPIRI